MRNRFLGALSFLALAAVLTTPPTALAGTYEAEEYAQQVTTTSLGSPPITMMLFSAMGTVPPALQPSALSTKDRRFLRQARQAPDINSNLTDAELINAARTTCRHLRGGHSMMYVDKVLRRRGMSTDQIWGTIVYPAIRVYCPDMKYWLQE